MAFHNILPQLLGNRIGSVMVGAFSSSAVDRGFETRFGQTKTIKLVCVASPLSLQH